MTTTETSAPAQTSSTLLGVACVVGGMMLFVVQDALVKAALADMTVWVVLMFRSFIAALVLAPLALALGPPHRLWTPLWPIQIARGAILTFGFSVFFSSFPFMGLAELTTIFFAAPLITALMAMVFLGERVGPHRAGALIVGFIGVLIAMNPTSDAFQWVAFMPLITATCYATAQILVRVIGHRDTWLTTGLYSLAPSGALLPIFAYALNALVEPPDAFAHLHWNWSAPIEAAPLAALAALFVTGAYVLSARGYQIADASAVAPFDYSYLPFAALLAYAVWGETPGWNTIIGMALIIGGGVYLGYRELRAARLGAGPPASTPIFAPDCGEDAAEPIEIGDHARR